jgi:hypothetical protein
LFEFKHEKRPTKEIDLDEYSSSESEEEEEESIYQKKDVYFT